MPRSTTATPPTITLDQRLAAEEARVRTELGRSETKAGVLITAAGMILSAVVAGAALGHVRPVVAAVGLLAGAAGAAVLILSVLVVLPRLGGRRSGWTRLAGADAQAVVAILTADDSDQDQARQLAFLAQLAVTKHQMTAAACAAMVASTVLLLVAGVLAVVGG